MAEVSKKVAGEVSDLPRTLELQQRLERLLEEAALVEVELSRADGTIRGVPHYSVIEGRAHALGKQLSCEVQRRQMRELAASQASTARCPDCGCQCEVHPCKRELQSVDGSTEAMELKGYCSRCRRAFFPSA